MKQMFIDRKLWARRIFLVCYDICAVFISAFLALIARFDFSLKEVPGHFLENMWKSMPAVVITTLLIFGIFRLYSSLWSYAGAMEMMYLVSACIVVTIVNMMLLLLSHPETGYPVPRSYYAFFGMFLFGLIFFCRYSYRALRAVRNMLQIGRAHV